MLSWEEVWLDSGVRSWEVGVEEFGSSGLQ
jgi:hypothetical protein